MIQIKFPPLRSKSAHPSVNLPSRKPNAGTHSPAIPAFRATIRCSVNRLVGECRFSCPGSSSVQRIMPHDMRQAMQRYSLGHPRTKAVLHIMRTDLRQYGSACICFDARARARSKRASPAHHIRAVSLVLAFSILQSGPRPLHPWPIVDRYSGCAFCVCHETETGGLHCAGRASACLHSWGIPPA